MSRFSQVYCVVVLFFFLLSGCAGTGAGLYRNSQSNSGETLSFKLDNINRIKNSIYEVVVKKPDDKRVLYERPLPLDQLPYAVRTDNYYSIGSAFAVSKTRFITAAHVLNLHTRSQLGEILLRDTHGSVYHIETIHKFSTKRDFAEFSVREKRANDSFLVLSEQKTINTKIYAIGNALGEGIIIRDGLYTSETPEEIDGEWKWLRFSAAVSPGNSGGPLLNDNGEVIGIVVKKTFHENLNFALPSDEIINHQENVADLDMRLGYYLCNMTTKERGKLKKRISLPKSFNELKKIIVTSVEQEHKNLLNRLLETNRDKIFPNGPGSENILYTHNPVPFPGLIGEKKDRTWDIFYPEKYSTANIGFNGTMVTGVFGNLMFSYVDKPDDIPAHNFLSDTKLFMDTLLKGISMGRKVANERIKIVSLGSAVDSGVHIDSFGRKWTLNRWYVPYSDSVISVMTLPLPVGCASVIASTSTGMMESHLDDMKVLSDFIVVPYSGKLREWQEYLSETDLLPSAFRSIDLSIEPESMISYSSERLAFKFDSKLLPLSDDAELELFMSFFNDNNSMVLDVTSIKVKSAGYDTNQFTISRNMKPLKQMREEHHKRWVNIVNKRFPYNESSFTEESTTVITTVVDPDHINIKDAPFAYTLTHLKDGGNDNGSMTSTLNRLKQRIKVIETGSDAG